MANVLKRRVRQVVMLTVKDNMFMSSSSTTARTGIGFSKSSTGSRRACTAEAKGGKNSNGSYD